MKETKEMILETAYRMFLANNYESVTINSIIQATGFTKGAIYHYFTSKEELFKAVIDEFLDKKEDDLLLEFGSIKELIANQVEKKREYLEKRSHILCEENCGNSNNIVLQHISLSLAACRYYPEFKETREVIFFVKKEQWEQILKKGIEQGEIKSDIDVEIATMNLMYAEATVALYSMSSGNLSIASILNLYERQMTEVFKYLSKSVV
jgi:TetR/AcrR family transcriptional regulator, transcriptional repressor for nem operon